MTANPNKLAYSAPAPGSYDETPGMLCSVAPHARIASVSNGGEPLQIVTIAGALHATWLCDAHVLPYFHVEGRPLGRVLKAELEDAELAAALRFSVLMFDVDAHELKGAELEAFKWRVIDFYESDPRLKEGFDLYETRGGLRFITLPIEPLDLPTFLDHHARAALYLDTRLAAVDACVDPATLKSPHLRMMRLPFVVRDGEPERRYSSFFPSLTRSRPEYWPEKAQKRRSTSAASASSIAVPAATAAVAIPLPPGESRRVVEGHLRHRRADESRHDAYGRLARALRRRCAGHGEIVAAILAYNLGLGEAGKGSEVIREAEGLATWVCAHITPLPPIALSNEALEAAAVAAGFRVTHASATVIGGVQRVAYGGPHESTRLLCLGWPMSGGKTHYMAAQHARDSQLVAVAPLRSVVRDLSERLGLEHYADREVYMAAARMPKLATTIHSIRWLVSSTYDDAVVFIDEAKRVKEHATIPNTTLEGAAQTGSLEKLSALLRGARHIVIADADLDIETIEWVRQMAGAETDEVEVSVCPDWQDPRRFLLYEGTGSVRAWMQGIVDALDSGRRVYVACQSKDMARDVAKLLEERRVKHLLFVAGDEVNLKPLIFRDIQAVCASPVLTTGVSIDPDVWSCDVVFGFACAHSSGVEGHIQQVARVRLNTSHEYHTLVSNVRGDFHKPLDAETILADIKAGVADIAQEDAAALADIAQHDERRRLLAETLSSVRRLGGDGCDIREPLRQYLAASTAHVETVSEAAIMAAAAAWDNAKRKVKRAARNEDIKARVRAIVEANTVDDSPLAWDELEEYLGIIDGLDPHPLTAEVFVRHGGEALARMLVRARALRSGDMIEAEAYDRETREAARVGDVLAPTSIVAEVKALHLILRLWGCETLRDDEPMRPPELADVRRVLDTIDTHILTSLGVQNKPRRVGDTLRQAAGACGLDTKGGPRARVEGRQVRLHQLRGVAAVLGETNFDGGISLSSSAKKFVTPTPEQSTEVIETKAEEPKVEVSAEVIEDHAKRANAKDDVLAAASAEDAPESATPTPVESAPVENRAGSPSRRPLDDAEAIALRWSAYDLLEERRQRFRYSAPDEVIERMLEFVNERRALPESWSDAWKASPAEYHDAQYVVGTAMAQVGITCESEVFDTMTAEPVGDSHVSNNRADATA